MSVEKVVVVTVTYGERWKFLSQVLDAVIRDPHLVRFVIIDNASSNAKEIGEARNLYPDKVDIIRSDINTGSAGGFYLGLEHARTLDCDFVLLLDDDNVPEQGAIQMYLDRYKTLPSKSVLSGFRVDIQDESIFTRIPKKVSLKKTFFDVWSLQKIKVFFGKVFSLKRKERVSGYYPIVPTPGFVYGGAFLPAKAIQEAPLPDKDLLLYGDDVEYSWGVLEKGYTSYLSNKPVIRDVDMSFEEGDHILGLLNQKTKPFKVYFRIRNMVCISRKHTHQNPISLFSSVFVWVLGLFVLGLVTYGPTRVVIMRMKLVIQAVYGGYVKNAKIPSIAKL